VAVRWVLSEDAVVVVVVVVENRGWEWLVVVRLVSGIVA
jgi:hypothetical protein